MGRLTRTNLWASRLIVAVIVLSSAASAKVSEATPYSKSQAYQGSLRYLRVDLGFDITEKDADSGYLLFQYRSPGREGTTSGSLEVVEQDDGATVIVRLPELPEHYEQHLVDGLIRKLRDQYGDPKPKKREDEKPAPPPEKDKEPKANGDGDKKPAD